MDDSIENIKENDKILIVEDDVNFGNTLKEYLILNDYDVNLAIDGEKGLEEFKKNNYDLCILDIMMPIKDGFHLAAEIKSLNKDIPIIFLTAKTQSSDIIEGYKKGADDYIKKPFNPEILLYKLKSIIKRSHGKDFKKYIFSIGSYEFDQKKRRLMLVDEEIILSPKESGLLSLLCKNINDVISRDKVLSEIWKANNYFTARSMDVYITKLRRTLSKDTRIKIVNIHGKGYSLIFKNENEDGEKDK